MWKGQHQLAYQWTICTMKLLNILTWQQILRGKACDDVSNLFWKNSDYTSFLGWGEPYLLFCVSSSKIEHI